MPKASRKTKKQAQEEETQKQDHRVADLAEENTEQNIYQRNQRKSHHQEGPVLRETQVVNWDTMTEQGRQSIYRDLKYLNIGSFSGLPNESPRTFLDQFNYKAELFKFDNPRKAQLFPLTLSGKAMLWFQSITKSGQLTWEDLVKNFKTEYITGNEIMQLEVFWLIYWSISLPKYINST